MNQKATPVSNQTTTRREAVRSLITKAKLEHFKKRSLAYAAISNADLDADYIAILDGPDTGHWVRDQDGEWRARK